MKRGIFSRFVVLFAAAMTAGWVGTNTARAAETASATVALTSTTGTAGSPIFNYTITVNDTGTTPIGTFWYAWTDNPINYDFLKSLPTVVASPTGWVSPVEGAGNSIDGYSIEWYNLSGSNIQPGGTGTFKFSTADSPSILAGNSPIIFPAPMQTSFIYSGTPQNDAGFSFVLPTPTSPAPEPASLALLTVGAGVLLLRPRRKMQTVPVIR